MSEFSLARERITEIVDFSVQISEFENNYEQRRLRNSGAVIGWKIESPALTYTQMTAYRSFFLSKYGPLTAFTFTNPLDGLEHTVRFVPGSFETAFEAGHYRCKFDFKKVVA